MTVFELGNGLQLRGVNDAPLVEAPAQFAPARWLVQEWREYVVEPSQSGHTAVPVSLRGVKGTSIGNALRFSFRNQLGLARLAVTTATETTAIDLEVVSPKFPTPDDHERFYSRLVSQLSEQSASLPFDVDAPTQLRTRESFRERSDLFIWHFFRQHHSQILEAARTIVRDPRRVLHEEEDSVTLDRVFGIEPGVLADVLVSPGNLEAVDSDSSAFYWPLPPRLYYGWAYPALSD